MAPAVFATPHCCVVADAARPDIWDANHADNVTAKTEAEIEAVFAAMDQRLGHTPWRVVHADCLTSDTFLARLALNDFEERFVAIRMALEGDVVDRGAPVELRPVATDGDWDVLLRLVMANHAERRDIDGFDFPPEFSAAMVETYRAKGDAYHFHLTIEGGVPIAYGGCAAAPNGVGMIEDLFTLPSARAPGRDHRRNRNVRRSSARFRLPPDRHRGARQRAAEASLCPPGLSPGHARPHLDAQIAWLSAP